MNRKEKIQLIEAVRAGQLLPEDIRPKHVHVFFQLSDKKGWKGRYKADEESIYTNEEYQAISNEIKAASCRREMVGLEADIIIRVIREEKRKIDV